MTTAGTRRAYRVASPVHVLVLSLACLLCSASAFAGQATAEPQAVAAVAKPATRGAQPVAAKPQSGTPATTSPPATQRPPALVKATPSPAIERWFDPQTTNFGTRYRMIETSAGVVSNNQMQGQVALRGRLKFDSHARVTLNASPPGTRSWTPGTRPVSGRARWRPTATSSRSTWRPRR